MSLVTIIQESKEYVFSLLKEKLPHEAVYHNFNHTSAVVEKAEEIANAEELEERQKDLLALAAWFHDTGYTVDFKDHESHSVQIAREFLKEKGLTEEDLQTIESTILATKMPQQPSNLMEQAMCDADLHHLGGEIFNENSSLLRLEMEHLCAEFFTDIEWLEKNESFLKEHSYFTNYAFDNWGNQKSLNWLSVEKDLKKIRLKEAERAEKAKLKKETVKLRKVKGDSPDRGIQTMYRVTLRNHIKLSDIADTKANILLSVSAIILSIALSILFPKLDKPANNYLIFPTLLFLLTTIITMVFSILATRPKVTSGKFNRDDVVNRKVNLLFFGNFHKMPLEDFKNGMKVIMDDKAYLYESLMTDLWFLGIVLNRKYKILRYAYNIFMFGIILSVIAYVVAFLSLEIE